MCTHCPRCPGADTIDWWAARNVADQFDQGWTLLCNGVVVFDDLGALLPDGRVATIPGHAGRATPVSCLNRSKDAPCMFPPGRFCKVPGPALN